MERKFPTCFVQSQSSTKASVRALKRFVFGSAAELEYDKQGRVLIFLYHYVNMQAAINRLLIVGCWRPR